MASSTPSAPITSFRGAADTTAGRIYFSTPSAQVQIPLTGPHLSPPHFCSHHTTEGKNMRWRPKKLSGGGTTIRAGAGGTKTRKKSENCRTVPKTPYSISLYIEPKYTLALYIEPNYTLSLYNEPNYTLS